MSQTENFPETSWTFSEMSIFSYDDSPYKSQLIKAANEGQDDVRYPSLLDNQ